VLDLISSGFFSRGDTELFKPLVESLLNSDPYLVLADYAAYSECQGRVRQAWKDKDTWTRMSILNSANSGYFSSDRSISEYAKNIWHVESVEVPLMSHQASQIGFIH
jgi:starch phosphorylase